MPSIKSVVLYSVVFTILCFSNLTNSSTINRDKTIKLLTVNSKNEPFQADSVSWWYVDSRANKHNLVCKTVKCAEWTLEYFNSPIIIRANASRIDDNDHTCFKLYSAEVQIKKPVKVVKIVLRYANTACRSQK